MSNYFVNGFLSENGQEVVQPFRQALLEVLGSQEVKHMSLDELRTLGGNLAKIVGDEISNLIISAQNNIYSVLDEMTEEEFDTFLKNKYGNRWHLVSLTSEELRVLLKRVPLISQHDLEKEMQKETTFVQPYMAVDLVRL